MIKEEELVVRTKGPSVAALRLRRNRDSPSKGSLLGVWCEAAKHDALGAHVVRI